MSNGKIDVAESCLEETGGLGVDIVLDAGGMKQMKIWSLEHHYFFIIISK